MYAIYCSTNDSDKAFIVDGNSLEDAVKEATLWADELSEDEAVAVYEMKSVAVAYRVSSVKVDYRN